MEQVSRAFWVRSPGVGEIRTEEVPAPGPDEVLVRSLYSGVSRGTESLVFRGGVPASQVETMRAPFQEGSFPGPVKYGYLSVGVVEQGPADLVGRTVFALYPHQTRYVVPAQAVVPLPASVPARRGVLTGAVETVVNALWDARPMVGDRVAVVGAGMIGCCAARILAGVPGIRLQMLEPDAGRAATARELGLDVVGPADAEPGCDLVVDASGNDHGLRRALELLGPDGEVLVLSWFGDREVSLPLGEHFHSRRLALRSSQVGTLSPRARPRHTTRSRLAVALDILADPGFDRLITGESAFDDLPEVMADITRPGADVLCRLITYPDADDAA